jgi:hypothetical protein
VSSAQLPGDASAPPDVLAIVVPESPGQGLPPAPDVSLEFLSLLAAEGVRTIRLDYGNWRAGAGLVHEFSPRTRLSVDVGYRRTYASPSDFASGEQMETQLGLRQVLDNTANLGLTYSFQDSRFGFRSRTHSFQAQVEKQFSPKFKADLSLGTSYLDNQQDPSSGWTLIGGAGFLFRLKRTTISARYGHTRYLGLILGHSQETDQVFASVGHVLGKRTHISAYGSHRNARDAQVATYSYSDSLLGVSLSVRIKKWGTVGLSYSYRRFDPGGSLPVVSPSVFSGSFGYDTTWK